MAYHRNGNTKLVIGVVSNLLAFSCIVEAKTFDFSYTFDLGTELYGTLSGTNVGNIIYDITDVNVFADGHSFQGNGSLTIFSWNNTEWVPGGAYISFNGAQNNFMFTNAPSSNVLDWTNQFFGITGHASSLPEAPPEICYTILGVPINGWEGLGDFPPNSSWSVTAVPELPSWVVMLVGFAGLSLAGCLRTRQRNEASSFSLSN